MKKLLRCAAHPEAAPLPSGEGPAHRAGAPGVRSRPARQVPRRRARDRVAGDPATRWTPRRLSAADVDYLMCVTSTGFMVPGLSSLFSRELGFARDLMRADVVGMGCNAGLNGLNPLVQWVENHPGKVALLVCCEINSAMYVLDDTPRTGIVNSLFGDGAAAAVLTSHAGTPADRCDPGRRPSGHRFRELLHSRAMGGDAVRLERRRRQVELLSSTGTSRTSSASTSASRWNGCWSATGWTSPPIKHWVLHTGGGAVIDSVKLSLGLDEHDVRHTRSVLRDYGNISSGSFLVSLRAPARRGLRGRR